VFDHPLHWQTENFLENFNGAMIADLIQEKECIDDILEMWTTRHSKTRQYFAPMLKTHTFGPYCSACPLPAWIILITLIPP
jgi:hypothetical protein